MLRRKIYDRLLEWKSKPGHKPLLLRGQRQVGKTFILKELAKTYPSCVYVDLSAERRVAHDITEAETVDDIVRILELRKSFRPVPGGTLIIFDEVQSCPSARASLKWFCQDGRYDVVASGSLLNVPLRSDGSDGRASLIPTGYETHMRMYGLDFEEFLWAKGYGEDLIGDVRRHIRQREPMKAAMLDTMAREFTEFMAVGGMPEAVSRYLDEGISGATDALDDIVRSNMDDVIKYAVESEVMRIRRTLESIPHQLSQSNKKFMYSRIEDNGRSRDGFRKYGSALLWIEGSGIGNMCYQLREISRPLSVSADRDQFKAYMSDTGMLLHMMDDGDRSAMLAVLSGDAAFNQGALAENAVAECLMKADVPRYYHINRKSPGRMELDFVVGMGRDTAAVEVKSGRDRTAPSLTNTLTDARFQRHVMFERGNIGVDGNGVEHYPLFAAAFIRDMWEEDRTSGFVPSGPSAIDDASRRVHGCFNTEP